MLNVLLQDQKVCRRNVCARRQPFVSGVVAYQRASRPVLDILGIVSDFHHCTASVSDFCRCRCWRNEQLHAICRPILAHCPFWRRDV